MRAIIPCALLAMAVSAAGQSNSKGTVNSARQSAVVEAVRSFALGYVRGLPNYTCLQTTHQTIHRTAGNDRGLATTVIVEQISFADNQEIRKTMRIDGRPVPANASDSVQGKSEGEFGNLIGIIFDSAKGSQLHWERTSTVNRVVTDVIAFRVPGSNGYILTERKRLTRVPFEGFVYADAQTHAILRIQLKGMMFPADSRYQALELMVDYKPTRVAGQEFILPSHFVLSYRTDELSQSNTADFMQYRRFGADTSIQFDSDAQ